jgi:signal transduction histidine kinase
MTAVLETLGGVVALLNPERQIVALNHRLLEAIGATDPQQALGLRPGEALGCTRVSEAPNGCGTGRACASCGAAIAIVSAAESPGPIERECLLTVQRHGKEESVEFLARARRVEIDGLPFTMVLLHDIQDQKRREVLERTFFHDILNTVGSLRTYGELVGTSRGHERDELLGEMEELLDRVVREVESHRDLVLAERGAYPVHPRQLSGMDVLRDLVVTFAHHEVTEGKELKIDCGDVRLTTDRTLLLRVLTNMVKNALEATPPGGVVRTWCDQSDDGVDFHVYNSGYIEPSVQLRIFQRSFTTKRGAGRGIGTYAMKLFAEQCLGGRVHFQTSPDTGTTFSVVLPRHLQ